MEVFIMAKKQKIKIPTFIEMVKSQRVQVVTPKGGPHKSDKDYNRQQDKEDLRKEESS